MTAELRFYHLTRTPLTRALPDLLTRALARGQRCVVRCGSPERLAAIDELLWVFDPASFLPHGSARDGDPARQPVWLTLAEEAPNGAGTLMLIDGTSCDAPERWTLVCDLFDGGDGEALAAARTRWRALTQAGLSPTYFAEREGGGWEKREGRREA